MAKIRACAYCRVSTNKDEQEQSFEAQQRYFKEKLSKENGYELIEVYADKGLTGTKFSNRTAFNQMLYDAGIDQKKNSANIAEFRNKYISINYYLSERKPKFNLIYVKDSSRFARNTEVTVIINKLRDKGVFVYFEDLNKSTEKIDEMVLIDFMFTLAQQESLDKSNKVKFGNKRSAEAGKIRNGNLYGYIYNKDENTLREDKDEADIVRLIFSKRLEGKGSRIIARELAEEGIVNRAGKNFITNRIRLILTNPTYTGKLVRNRYEMSGTGVSKSKKYLDSEKWIIKDSDKVDSIIDKETFNRVQELITASTVSDKGVYRGRKDLAGKIKCSICGKSYIRYSANYKDKKYYYYVCTNKKKNFNVCNNINIKETDMEQSFERYLNNGVYKEEVKIYINLLKIIIVDKASVIFKDVPVEKVNEIEAEINKYKKQLARLLDQLLEDETRAFKEVFDMKKTAINDKIRVLEEELKELTIDDKIKEEKLERLNSITEKIEAYEKNISEEITREDFIKEHLVKIIVAPNNTLTVITKGIEFTTEVFSLLGMTEEEANNYLKMTTEDENEILKRAQELLEKAL